MARRFGRRFGHLPDGMNFCVYIAELSNGVIKVGKTACPSHRITQLDWQVSKDYGCSVGRVHISRRASRMSSLNAERDLIHAMRKVGTSLPNRREFFAGVSFDDAVAIAEKAAANA